ncbi:GDP-mannose mannosyl hydrolase [Pseudomonas sp. WN033]|nr:GDP-mannose mannosyl hydrolase [Pseudomonas sp. WN033]
MWLNAETFRRVVAATPLVSIDLLVENHAGEVLLGQRLNRPAQGFWFVPGGRIQKNETLDGAFLRLTSGELGEGFERSEARLLGVYEHFYPDSVFGEAGNNPDTHYVVLGYYLRLPPGLTLNPPTGQHGCYRWWSKAEMQTSVDVHDNSRAYLAALS